MAAAPCAARKCMGSAADACPSALQSSSHTRNGSACAPASPAALRLKAVEGEKLIAADVAQGEVRHMDIAGTPVGCARGRGWREPKAKECELEAEMPAPRQCRGCRCSTTTRWRIPGAARDPAGRQRRAAQWRVRNQPTTGWQGYRWPDLPAGGGAGRAGAARCQKCGAAEYQKRRCMNVPLCFHHPAFDFSSMFLCSQAFQQRHNAVCSCLVYPTLRRHLRDGAGSRQSAVGNRRMHNNFQTCNLQTYNISVPSWFRTPNLRASVVHFPFALRPSSALNRQS